VVKFRGKRGNGVPLPIFEGERRSPSPRGHVPSFLIQGAIAAFGPSYCTDTGFKLPAKNVPTATMHQNPPFETENPQIFSGEEA